MRTREKLVIVLIVATVVLGMTVFLYFSSNELEANYYRWALADTLRRGITTPLRNFFEGLPPSAVLFGSVGIFMAVIFVIGIKLLRDRELESLRRRLMMIGTAKTETESLLQEEVWKGRHERQARDSAMRDLEVSIEKIERLIVDLDEKERLLNARDIELLELKSDNGSFAVSESSGAAVDRSLRSELSNANRILQEKNAAIKELESAIDAKTKLLNSQLREKNALLRSREEELDGLRSELDNLSGRLGDVEAAKKRSEDLLRAELAQKSEVLEANEVSIRNEQIRLSEKIHGLEAELSDKDRILKGRDSELDAIRKQLSETVAAKEKADKLLEEKSLRADEDRRARDSQMGELEQKRNFAVRALQDEMAQKNLLLQVREDELRGLKAEVKAVTLRMNELAAGKEQAEKSLAEEIRKTQQFRRDRETSSRELENRHGKEISDLQSQLAEKSEFLKNRERENLELKAQVTSVAEQIKKLGAASQRTVGSLQEQIRKERESRQASDSAFKMAEESLKSKIAILEKQLVEKQSFVGGRDAEVAALRSERDALNQRTAELAAAKEEAEILLREVISEKTDLLRSKDAQEAALKNFQENHAAALRAHEDQLLAKDSLLQTREAELQEFRGRLGELSSSKDHALRLLQETVQQKSEQLEEKDAALRTIEERFAARIRTLEEELNDRQEMLRNRDTQLKNVVSEVNQLTGQLSALNAAKDDEGHSLRDQLKQRTELLEAREAALKAEMDKAAEDRRFLEDQLREKLGILETRDSEVDALMAKVTELTQSLAELSAQRERSDRLVQEQLRGKSALLEAKESALEEAGTRMVSKIQSLERHVEEKHKLLETSGAELAELRAQNQLILQRMSEIESAKARAESLLEEERLRASQMQVALVPANQRADGEFAGDQQLETILNERKDILKSRDKLIQDLMAELKEKKSQLAKFEIEVWQDIERREAWKKRLSRIGIRLKN